MEWFGTRWWQISFLMQVIAAVHAVKTGRSNWLGIILLLPLVGPLFYLFTEVLPASRVGTTKVSWGSLFRLVDPQRELRRLRDNLDVCNSVANKVALAAECINCGLYDEAIQLYQNCLEGHFKNDPIATFGLASAYFAQNDYAKAQTTLLQLLQNPQLTKAQTNQAHLLLVLTLERMNDTEAALREYTKLIPNFLGDEARCRYALLLKKTGDQEHANQIFRDIVKDARRAPKHYRHSERYWIALAKKYLR